MASSLGKLKRFFFDLMWRHATQMVMQVRVKHARARVEYAIMCERFVFKNLRLLVLSKFRSPKARSFRLSWLNCFIVRVFLANANRLLESCAG